jgi:hypothetical protein
LAHDFGLPERYLQIPSLALGGHESILHLLFAVMELCKMQQLAHCQTTFSSTKVTNVKNRPTGGHSVELRSGLYGLALLLGELVFEPLFLHCSRFMDLFELPLKVEDQLFLLGRILRQVGPALSTFRQGL